MKRNILLILLCFLILLSSFVTVSAAEETTLSAGAKLSTGQASSGTGEYILTYKPSADVRPVVFFGTTLYGRTAMDQIQSELLKTGETPVAGVNASFFDMANGIPYGLEVTEGILRTSGTGPCVGIRADGKLLLGDPETELTVTWPDGSSTSTNYNKMQTSRNGLVLYSRDFDERIKGGGELYCVFLEPDQTELKLGATVRAKVQRTATGNGLDIPEGSFVLTERSDGFNAVLKPLKALKVGDQITIQVKSSQQWQDVQSACGAGEILVEQGSAKESFTLDSAQKKAPRTALGLRSDGSAVFYVVDGNAKETVGLTLSELAQRMVSLGCVQAINLDGGGSSTMSVLENGSWKTVNKPSDGAQRACANFLFLIYDVGKIQVQAPSGPVMTGGKINLNLTAASPSGLSIPTPGGVSGKAELGSVDGTFYKAPQQAGTDQVTLQRGDLETSCTVQVLAPDCLQLTRADTGSILTGRVLRLDAGEKINLNALATNAGVKLLGSDASFTWRCDETIGSVDENGVLSVKSTEAADGLIQIQNGSLWEALDVVVNGGEESVRLLADFESGEDIPSGGARNTGRGHVRYGASSLSLSHDAGNKAYTWNIPMSAQERRVGVWAYGDGSGAELNLLYRLGGQALSTSLGTLDFTGWRYLRAALQEGEKQLTGLELNGAASAGTVYLDQLVASRYYFRDSFAPLISAQTQGGTLSAAIQDEDSELSQQELSVSLDGKALSSSWQSGVLSAKLPEDGKMHKLTIYAADVSGNRSSLPVTVPGSAEQAFSDTASHWANKSINYLAQQGILNGSRNAAGLMVYRPDDTMTRQEFLVAAVSALKVNLEDYKSATLPFADNGQIASWALPYCRAAYALGLLQGSSSGNALYCYPRATISRQEAMAILARTQPMGYEEDDLSSFSDRGSISSWARSDIAVMVRRGVISGSGGRLDPNGTVTRAQVAQILYQLY